MKLHIENVADKKYDLKFESNNGENLSNFRIQEKDSQSAKNVVYGMSKIEDGSELSVFNIKKDEHSDNEKSIGSLVFLAAMVTNQKLLDKSIEIFKNGNPVKIEYSIESDDKNIFNTLLTIQVNKRSGFLEFFEGTQIKGNLLAVNIDLKSNNIEYIKSQIVNSVRCVLIKSFEQWDKKHIRNNDLQTLPKHLKINCSVENA